MKHERWKCTKCGKCCSNQYVKMDLFEHELPLFPKSSYRPYIGYGPTKEDVTVFLWQLKTKRCPLYDDKQGCTEYHSRPLICKRFPFLEDGLDWSCSNVSRTKAYLTHPFDLVPVADYQRESSRIFADVQKKAEATNSKLWLYNHKKGKWKLLNMEKHLMDVFGEKVLPDNYYLKTS